ncbi:MAG: GDP-mannose 4,6-dehydratase [Candidatus Krumholzibacteria bacterium]|nr:GDP-mannose 4,6-dehydratase [Candidatus Krumholzibacteria bacterium]
MRIIVTGAAGFVGRYLVSELDGAGYEVLGIDMVEGTDGGPPDGYPPPPGVKYRRCDLTLSGETGAVIAEWKPQGVFHLAAQSSAARSFEQPRETFEINIFGSLNILEAVRAVAENSGEPVRILSVGSCEEYGRKGPDEMPLTEESTVEPVSPYAVSKAAQSMLMLQYHAAYGIDTVVTRSFSHTGPGQPDRFVLPSFARQCAGIRAGSSEPKIRVGNLDVTRDFLDVRDAVRAYRLLFEKGKSGTVYNVCRGEGVALKDALDALTGMTERDVEVEIDPALFRPADVPVLVGDNGRLRSDTGWNPSITTEEMLTDLFVFWSTNIKKFQAGSG